MTSVMPAPARRHRWWVTVDSLVAHALPRTCSSVIAPLERYVLGGIACGRFAADDPAVAVNAVGGVVLQVLRAKLLGDVGPTAEGTVGEEVLRLLGVDAVAAHALNARPLPFDREIPVRRYFAALPPRARERTG